MSLAPRTHVQVVYAGVDITKDISKDLLSLSYTDNEGGTADDISIRLKNNHGLWSGAWFPQEGDAIEATIITENDTGVKRLPCGRCEIDEIELSGAPSILEIKGVAVPLNNTIRRKKKSRAWENVRLSEIASDIAGAGSMDLLFQPNPGGAPISTPDPLYDRRDQRDESDLQFLARLCSDEGLSLKISANQLIVYDVSIMEQQQASVIFELGKSNVLNYSFKTQAHNVYKTAVVQYNDPDTGDLNQFTYTDPAITEGQELKVVKRATSIEEAERIGFKALQKKNRLKVTGTLVVVGRTDLVSGIGIEIIGFGKFDGKYYVNKSEHTVGTGYTVSMDINKVG